MSLLFSELTRTSFFRNHWKTLFALQQRWRSFLSNPNIAVCKAPPAVSFDDVLCHLSRSWIHLLCTPTLLRCYLLALNLSRPFFTHVKGNPGVLVHASATKAIQLLSRKGCWVTTSLHHVAWICDKIFSSFPKSASHPIDRNRTKSLPRRDTYVTEGEEGLRGVGGVHEGWSGLD